MKNIKAQIVQHCEVTMVNKHFTRVVAEMETREGCPITPGASLSKVFHLTPMAKNSKDRGVALDGQLKVGRMRRFVVLKFTWERKPRNKRFGPVTHYRISVVLVLTTIFSRAQDADVNLASSTLAANDRGSSDALGVVISYSVRIRLNCGALGGELMADLPFKLLHPQPGSEEQQQQRANQKAAAIDRSNKGEDIVFEEFSKLRRGKSIDDL